MCQHHACSPLVCYHDLRKWIEKFFNFVPFITPLTGCCPETPPHHANPTPAGHTYFFKAGYSFRLLPDLTPPIAPLCDLFHLSSVTFQVVRMLNLAALSSNYGRRQNSSDYGALFDLHNLFTTICLHRLNDKLKKRFQLCSWRSYLSLSPFCYSW